MPTPVRKISGLTDNKNIFKPISGTRSYDFTNYHHGNLVKQYSARSENEAQDFNLVNQDANGNVYM